MSEGFTNIVIAAITMMTPTLAIIVGSYVANTNAKRAAVAAEHVASTLSKATEVTNDKLDTIHVLVNSRLTEALKKIDRLEAKLLETQGIQPTGEPPAAPVATELTGTIVPRKA